MTTIGTDTPPQSSDAKAVLAAGASLDAQMKRAHELTLAAARSLGMDEEAAAVAAADGGVVLGGTLVTVSPLPLEALTGDNGDDGALVVSASMGCRLDALGATAVATLFAHAPGLLAVYDATIGCAPGGELALHRVVRMRDAAPEALAEAMLVSQQLAALMAGVATQTGQPS